MQFKLSKRSRDNLYGVHPDLVAVTRIMAPDFTPAPPFGLLKFKADLTQPTRETITSFEAS
ncbi:hypothetical protein THIOSC15_170003 [uncultured Thiomicrorhabdus sp.]